MSRNRFVFVIAGKGLFNGLPVICYQQDYPGNVIQEVVTPAYLVDKETARTGKRVVSDNSFMGYVLNYNTIYLTIL